jgi:hypothetical protein
MSITKALVTSVCTLSLAFGRTSCIILQFQNFSEISLMFIILTRLTPYCTSALGERQDYTLCRMFGDVAAHT